MAAPGLKGSGIRSVSLGVKPLGHAVLQGRIHGAAVPVAAAAAEHFQTVGGVSPADDGQFHIAAAPFLHQLLVRLVNVNGSGPDQGAPVIVNDVEIGLPLDAEGCSQRVNGPVRSGAAHGRSVFQRRANGIPGSVGQMVTVASVAMAKRMERYGADAVVAEGMEAGGHIGNQTTMALIPQIVDAVNIPVIAAGGIGDGRGVAASFMLGAEGVQMGTRFVVADESIVHDNYKDRIVKAKDIDSVVTGQSTGHPVRCLRNQMTKEYIKKEQEGVPFEELERMTLGSLRKAVMDGDILNGTVMAGQIAGLVSKRQSCKEILQEIMTEAEKLLHC